MRRSPFKLKERLMNRFVRPNRQQPNAPGSSQINFAAAKKTVLLDPGRYELRIERAESVRRQRT